MVTYTPKQFLLIILVMAVLAVILGAVLRMVLGIEAATPYIEQMPLDGLGGLLVMLGLILAMLLKIGTIMNSVKRWI